MASGAAALAVVVLGACGSSSAGGAAGSGSSSTINIGEVSPYSGPDAAFGPLIDSACFPAVSAIDADGGVLGHKLSCVAVDTRGDPGDAVPAVEKFLAGGNVGGVLGPSSDEASTIVPLLNQSRVTMFSGAGQSQFDKTTDAYFWRGFPPDVASGIALSVWAYDKGYRRVAFVYTTSAQSQGEGPAAVASFRHLGGSVAATVELSADATSFGTEVAKVVQAKPDAIIFTDAGAQTGAIFFGELVQQGSLPPVIGSEQIAEPPFQKAVAGAIGGAPKLASGFTSIQFSDQIGTPGWQAFRHWLVADASRIPQDSTYADDPYSIGTYDAVNVMALAMLAAKSTSPAVYNAYIMGIANGQPGAVIVHDFAEGKAALAAGRKIQYVGAGGVMTFNRFHNSTSNFHATTDSANPQIIGTVSPRQIASLLP